MQNKSPPISTPVSLIFCFANINIYLADLSCCTCCSNVLIFFLQTLTCSPGGKLLKSLPSPSTWLEK